MILTLKIIHHFKKDFFARKNLEIKNKKKFKLDKIKVKKIEKLLNSNNIKLNFFSVF